MKFSLKQLIVFVTFAALLCGIAGYAFTRIKVAEQHALALRHEALEQAERVEANQQMAEAPTCQSQATAGRSEPN